MLRATRFFINILLLTWPFQSIWYKHIDEENNLGICYCLEQICRTGKWKLLLESGAVRHRSKYFTGYSAWNWKARLPHSTVVRHSVKWCSNICTVAGEAGEGGCSTPTFWVNALTFCTTDELSMGNQVERLFWTSRSWQNSFIFNLYQER